MHYSKKKLSRRIKEQTYSAIFLKLSVIRWRSRLLVGVPFERIYILPRRRTSRSQVRSRRRRPRSLFRQIGLMLIRARQQFSMWRGTPRALLQLVARLQLMLLLLAAGRRPVRCGRSRAIAGNASGWCVQLRRL